MKCPQKIMVSISHEKNVIDLELPTDCTIENLKKSIMVALESYYKDKKINTSINKDLKLYCNEKELDESKILANYGIWDGSLLVLR